MANNSEISLGKCLQVESSNIKYDWPETSDEAKAFAIVWYILLHMVAFWCTFVYLKRKKQSEFIQRRNTELVLLVPLGLISLATNNGGLREYLGKENWNCLAFTIFSLLTLNCFIWSQFVRVFVYYYRIEYNRQLARETFGSFMKFDHLKAASDTLAGQGRPDKALTDAQNSSNLTVQVSEDATEASPYLQRLFDDDTPQPALVRARFLASKRFAFILLIGHFLISLALAIVVQGTYELYECNGCLTGQAGDVAYMIYIIFIAVLTILSFRRLRNEPDPLGIKREIKIYFIVCASIFTVYVVFSLSDPGDLEAKGEFFWGYIIDVAGLVAIYVVTWLQVKNSFIHESNKQDLEYSNEGALQGLEEVLRSDVGRELFKAHLVNELSIENYYFYREVTYWNEKYGNNPDGVYNEDREQTADFIMKTFLTSGSELEVCCEYSIMREVKSLMFQRKFGQPAPNGAFDKALQSVLNHMAIGSYARFKESDLYREYLS